MSSLVNMLTSPYHIKLAQRLIKNYNYRGVMSRIINTYDIDQSKPGLFFKKLSSVHRILKKD